MFILPFIMMRIFLECICVYVKQLWNHCRLFLTKHISLPILTPQTAIFGFINGIENSVYKIKNQMLLIFKLHVYKSRERGILELSRLIIQIKKVINPNIYGENVLLRLIYSN